MSFPVNSTNSIGGQQRIEANSGNESINKNLKSVFSKESMSNVTGSLLTKTTEIKKTRTVSILDNTKGKNIGEAIKQVLQNICHNLSCLFSSNQQDKQKLVTYLDGNFSKDCTELQKLTDTYSKNLNIPKDFIKKETDHLKEVMKSLKGISSGSSSEKKKLEQAVFILSNCIEKIETTEKNKELLRGKNENELKRLTEDRTKSQIVRQAAAQILEKIENLKGKATEELIKINGNKDELLVVRKKADEIWKERLQTTNNYLEEFFKNIKEDALLKIALLKIKEDATLDLKIRGKATEILNERENLVWQDDNDLRWYIDEPDVPQMKKDIAVKILRNRDDARKKLSTQQYCVLKEILRTDSNDTRRVVAYQILLEREIKALPNKTAGELCKIKKGYEIFPFKLRMAAAEELLKRDVIGMGNSFTDSELTLIKDDEAAEPEVKQAAIRKLLKRGITVDLKNIELHRIREDRDVEDEIREAAVQELLKREAEAANNKALT